MDFFRRFKKAIVSLLCQHPPDEDAGPDVGPTWCIHVDTRGCKVFKRPFFMHFDCPGEAKEWASTMVGMDYAISEPFFCPSPEKAAACFEASGSKWMYQPDPEEFPA